jgi:hypothetical protein
MINATDFTNEADYNAGLDEQAADFFYTNPLQEAFNESRSRTQIVNQSQKIAFLLAEGKFVGVSESEHNCPVTDATIGYSIQIDSVHDTLEQARVVCPRMKKVSISRPNGQLGKKRP